jgi:prepilin-type N-terminal cleavage/methylation domain-containing protein
MNVPQSSEKRRGFTLVELIVVVAIIGILTAIAFVSLLHYRTVIRVNATARDLAGHMRLARAKAIRDGRSVMANFDANQNRYVIVQDPEEDGQAPYGGGPRVYYLQPGIRFGYFPSINNVPGHRYPVTCAIDIRNCGSSFAHFRRDGSVTYDGVLYLIPSVDLSATGNRDDRMRAVDWDSMTGRIRVWKWKYRDRTWR